MVVLLFGFLILSDRGCAAKCVECMRAMLAKVYAPFVHEGASGATEELERLIGEENGAERAGETQPRESTLTYDRTELPYNLCERPFPYPSPVPYSGGSFDPGGYDSKTSRGGS